MTARSTPIPVGALGVDPLVGVVISGVCTSSVGGGPLRGLQLGGVISGGVISRGLSPAFVNTYDARPDQAQTLALHSKAVSARRSCVSSGGRTSFRRKLELTLFRTSFPDSFERFSICMSVLIPAKVFAA